MARVLAAIGLLVLVILVGGAAESRASAGTSTALAAGLVVAVGLALVALAPRDRPARVLRPPDREGDARIAASSSAPTEEPCSALPAPGSAALSPSAAAFGIDPPRGTVR